jgi:hypothetical protein
MPFGYPAVKRKAHARLYGNGEGNVCKTNRVNTGKEKCLL